MSLARQRLAAALVSVVAIGGALAAQPEAQSSAVLATVDATDNFAAGTTTGVAPTVRTTTVAVATITASDIDAAVAVTTALAVETSSIVSPTSIAVAPTAPPEVVAVLTARPIPPTGPPAAPAPEVPRPAWADSTRTTGAGYVATDVGCAGGTDAGSLDAFFADRVGPMIGSDYQHVYPLGGDRFLWLFQDAFIDHSGGATSSRRPDSPTTSPWCRRADASRCTTVGASSGPARSSWAPART